jgi:hypothetical protein
MAQFNVNKFRLVDKIGFDPLFGKDPLPEETRARDLHTVRNPGRLPLVQSFINSALAGSRVRGGTRGGAFAPRATSGMS